VLRVRELAFRTSRAHVGHEQPFADSLVVPFPVVVRSKLLSSSPERAFTEGDHSVEALVLDRPDKPLGMSVQKLGDRAGKLTIWTPAVVRRSWNAKDGRLGTSRRVFGRLPRLTAFAHEATVVSW